jgi:DNA replication and repair protein RecF
MIVGSTLHGPHRDDLIFYLGEKQAKTFSSEGQKRTCISSLRFAEWERLRTCCCHPPLLGIDDFGIQLDHERRTQMKSHFKQFGQVFITTPLPLEKEILGECLAFHIDNGSLAVL